MSRWERMSWWDRGAIVVGTIYFAVGTWNSTPSTQIVGWFLIWLSWENAK